jgi:murein DD-endopeptidase MepM/ murein hydrolase activator NlpD
MNRTARVTLGLAAAGVILGTALTVASVQHLAPWSTQPSAAVVPAAIEAEPEPEPITESLSLRRGDTLGSLLGRAGVDDRTRMQVVAAIQEAFDVRKLRAGAMLTLVRSASGALESLEYIIDPDRKLQLSKSEDTVQASVVEIPGILYPAAVCGTLSGSLFESVERTGERAELAIQMAELFAWDIDFYRDPQEGDEFCLLVEKKEYENGQPPTYRRILAAKYVNVGKTYEAFMHPDKNGKPQYYSRDGKSLQSAFLRSPLKFEARVSSRFSTRRLHPVLKVNRPHWGTDYAAPAGTPVHSVAAGQVTFSGYSGGAGNLIRVRHAGGYETQYLHLSRRLVRVGQKVSQGQRIGLVGATGLATGPHLDIRLSKNGRFMDFEKLRAPRASSIEAAQLAAFVADRDQYAAMMSGGAPGRVVLASSGMAAESGAGTP